MALVMSTNAHAETVGVSMAKFDDNFLTVLRNGMTDYAKTLSGVTLQVEDAQNDVSKQQSQIQNFIASKVDAIIVNPVDTDATRGHVEARGRCRHSAGLRVNRQPVNVDSLAGQAGFRRFQRAESGCWKPRKSAVFSAAGQGRDPDGRTSPTRLPACAPRTFMTLSKTDECKGIADRRRADGKLGLAHQGSDLMTNWLSSGIEFDAVISNNDEMAIGAIQALKAAGKDHEARSWSAALTPRRMRLPPCRPVTST